MTMVLDLKPETELLVRNAIRKGYFSSIDELIQRALAFVGESETEESTNPRPNFSRFMMESPLRGSGLVLSREKNYPRAIDL